MLPPIQPRSVVITIGGLTIVVRPGGCVIVVVFAAILTVIFLPGSLPGASPITYSLVAGLVLLLIGATILLHEIGHALAFYVQGMTPVRITLHAAGGACAAVVTYDTPRRSLVRALSGPLATASVAGIMLIIWHMLPSSSAWRAVSLPITIFSSLETVVNVLPLHPRGDGAVALRSLLWLIEGREPNQVLVLYLWRPLILIAAGLLMLMPGGLLATGLG
jgi:hypothetical protein